jgi:hypothetical protein
LEQQTKTGRKIPKINDHKIYQMIIKYSNVFRSKPNQNVQKMMFFVCKYTIWQPWSKKGIEVSSRRTRISLAYKNSKKGETSEQGCQIFLDRIYQTGGKYTYHIATELPIGHNMFQRAEIYSK